MSGFRAKLYTDAHDSEPADVFETQSLASLTPHIIASLDTLGTFEESDLCIGSAGDGEAFEIYPRLGSGTVVVEEIE